jgi:hypothetical protein
VGGKKTGAGDDNRFRESVVAPGHMIDAGGEFTPRTEEANRAGGELPGFDEETLTRTKSNWITDASWINQTGTPVTYFRAEWKVPPKPHKRVRQFIYLFIGMEPAIRAPLQTILQPVLEWGMYKE